MEINDEKPAVNYPITVYRFGNVPLKAPSKNGAASGKNKSSAMPLLDDDFGDFDTDFKETSFDDDDDFDDEEEDTGYNDVFEEDDED